METLEGADGFIPSWGRAQALTEKGGWGAHDQQWEEQPKSQRQLGALFWEAGSRHATPKVGHCSMEIVPDSTVRPRAGQFLLSEPFLTDPWFGRKTVFVCDHDPDGTVGLVLDNGTGRRLKEVLPESRPGASTTKCFWVGRCTMTASLPAHLRGRNRQRHARVARVVAGGDLDGIRALLSRPEKASGQIRFFIDIAVGLRANWKPRWSTTVGTFTTRLSRTK